MSDFIEKSGQDSRVYKHFTLDNKILCLAISDPETEHAAASMNVRVGSIFEETHGIAHFLEHMLFMGTKKYPEENEYQNFLSDHAGFSNAYTGSENTNYYFKVNAGDFHHALDIFAQFFISPLFNPESVDRELKAVDSEYNKNILDDSWRIYQILRNSLSHPFNHFGSGNSATLRFEGVREKMIEFYNKYYSSNIMSLVFYGKESIEVLEQWARELFEEVPNKNVELPVREKPKFGNVLTLTKMIPVKDTRILRLLWTIPYHTQYYRYKPDRYLSNLLGHEGKNSLLSYLKYENLADGLTSYLDDDFECFSSIYIDIKLTDKGLSQYERILEICCKYIRNLQALEPEEYIFEELKAVAFSEFTFKNKEDPYWFCQKLCSRFHLYPPSKILSGVELFEEFNPSLIKETLNYLTVDNLQVYLSSQSFEKSEMITEKWYGTLYSNQKLSEDLVNRLKNPSIDTQHKQLSNPPRNPYVTRSHEILPTTTEKYPVEILNSDQCRVFYKSNLKFITDKVYGQVIIFCNSARFDVSAFSFILGEVWNKIIAEKLREEIYQADIASLKHSIDIDNHGVKISLNGFAEQYPKFFQYLVKSLAELKPDESDRKMFEDIKTQMIINFKNTFYGKPYEQVQRLMYEINLQGGYFVTSERLNAITSIEFEDLIWFSNKWLKNVYFEWLVVGNIGKERVLQMANDCVSTFVAGKNPSFLQPNEYVISKALKISKGKKNIYRSLLTDVNDTNSAVLSQWQIGPETVELQSLVALVDTYLEEPCFNILRTKEQLGYIVWSYTHKIRGVLNLVVVIQSSVKCPAYLFGRITDFIKSMQTDLETVDDTRFEKIKSSSIKSTFKKDLSLRDEFNRYKFEVDSASYMFNRRKLVKECMRKTNKEQFKEFFNSVFFGNERRFNLQVLADKMKEEEGSFVEEYSAEFKDLSEFWRKNQTWPQVYIRNR